MLDDNVYSLKPTANAESNIAVFSTDWKCDGSHKLSLNGKLYSAIEFANQVDLHNCVLNEDMTITTSSRLIVLNSEVHIYNGLSNLILSY